MHDSSVLYNKALAQQWALFPRQLKRQLLSQPSSDEKLCRKALKARISATNIDAKNVGCQHSLFLVNIRDVALFRLLDNDLQEVKTTNS